MASVRSPGPDITSRRRRHADRTASCRPIVTPSSVARSTTLTSSIESNIYFIFFLSLSLSRAWILLRKISYFFRSASAPKQSDIHAHLLYKYFFILFPPSFLSHQPFFCSLFLYGLFFNYCSNFIRKYI